MNEHKKYIRQQEKFASNHEISLAELNSLLGLLYSRARDAGAVAVLMQLEQLRKTLAKNNPNRKLLRAAENKLEKLQRELNQKIL